MKTLRSYILISVIALGLLIAGKSFAASPYYVNNPSLCPTDAFSQSCVGGLKVCGVNPSNVVSCYNTGSLSAPASQGSTSSNTATSTGGYYVDCYAYDSAAPYCDNSGSFYCMQNTTCSGLQKVTLCTANTWAASTCGSCKAGYNDCDGNSANGCSGATEHDGVACTTGLGLPGTYQNCVCVGSVLKLGSDSVTGLGTAGTSVVQGGTAAMLFVNGNNVGIGTSLPNDIFSIANSGVAPAGSDKTGHNYASTYLSDDDYALANYGLVKSLINGSGAGFWGGSLASNIWSLNSGNLGIGTTNPTYKLDIISSSVNGGLMVRSNNAANRPNINLRSEFTNTTGYAANLLSHKMSNTVTEIEAGSIGVYGQMVTDPGVPTVTYMYFGTEPTIAYNNNTFRLYPNKNAYFDGSVGIGTTNPSYKFDVQSPTIATPVARFYATGATNNYGPNVVIRNNDTSVYAWSGIQFQNAAGTNVLDFGGAGSTYNNSAYPALLANSSFINAANNMGMVAGTGDFLFQTGTGANGIKMVIKNSGNVGIGTTAPNDVFSIGNSGTAPAGSDKTGHNYTSTYLTTDNYALANYGIVKSLIYDATSSLPAVTNYWSGTKNANIWNGDAGQGNVGIGTTTPNTKLNIYASSGAEFTLFDGFYNYNIGGDSQNIGSNYWSIYKNSSDTYYKSTTGGHLFLVDASEKMRVDRTGNIGIGTSSPAFKLDVYSSSNDVLNIQAPDPRIAFKDGSSASSWYLQAVNNNRFRLSYGGSEFLSANQAGNIGVGITNPAAKLQVAGTLVANYAAINLTPNGDFETGTLSGFTGFNGIESTDSKDGLYSAYNDTASSAAFGTEFIPVDPDGYFYLEAWFKSVGVSGLSRIYFGTAAYNSAKVALLGNGGTYGYCAASAADVPNTWTKYTCTLHGEGSGTYQFPAGTRYVKPLFLFNYQGGSGYKVLVDGIRYINGSAEEYTQAGNLSIFSRAGQGNVGIGTTAPNDIFSIGNSGSAPAGSDKTGHNYTSTYLSTDNYALANYGAVKSMINAATSSITLWGGTTAGNIWSLNSTNVGIGTTNPGQKLEVNGNIRTTVDNSLPNIVLDSSGSGDNWTSQGAYISLGESGSLGSAALHLTYVGNGSSYIGSGAVTSGIPAQSYLRFAYDSKNIYTDSNLQNAATGTSYFMGSLGIGTTNPGAPLEVKNNSTSGYVDTLKLNALGAIAGHDLSMTNSYGRNLRIRQYNSNGTGPLSGSAFFQENGGSLLFVTNTANPIYFATNNRWATADMIIDSNGNVGIDTTAPNDVFSIGNSGSAPAGSSNTGHNYTSTYLSTDDYALANYGVVKTLINAATSSSALWGGTTGGNIWNLNSANVGIGNNNPTSLLTVGNSGVSAPVDILAQTGDTAASASLTLSSGGFISNLNSFGDDGILSINVGGTNSMNISDSGNIGVGVYAPDMKLVVSGPPGLPATSGTSQNGALRLGANDGGTEVLDFGFNPANGAGWLQISNSANLANHFPLYLQPRGGNIGIGMTVTPNDIFSIGNSGAAPAGSSNTGHNYTSTYLSTDDYALANYGIVKTLINAATSSSALWGGTTGGNIWSLNSSNVGIGTTSPATKLNIFGTSNAVRMSYDATHYGELSTDSSGNNLWHSTGFVQMAGDNSVGDLSGQSGNDLSILGDPSGGAGKGVYLKAWNSSGSAWRIGLQYLNTAGEPNLSLVPVAGNVGIGTTIPYAKLEVNGGDVYIWNNGNNPRFLVGDSASGGNWAGFRWLSASDILQIGTDTGGYALNLNESGNVGIGTTAPNDIFSIGNSGSAPAGSANTGHNYTNTYLSTDDYALANYGLVKTMISSATGSLVTLWGGTLGGNIWNLNATNVGIGTTTASQKLSVEGSIRLPMTTDSVSGVIYKDTTPFIHNFKASGTSGGNFFAGEGAGNFIMGGSNSYDASYNTGVGYWSLKGLTTGRRNTALGYYSMTASNNANIESVAVGWASAYQSNSGGGNVSVGASAGYGMVSSSYNTFIGSRAGYGTSGGSNTALGNEAGYGSLASSTYANAVLLGSNSGHSLTTGSNNTFVGYFTGYSATTSANNVILGYHSGYGLTSGSNNIIIGYDISAPIDTGNNQMTIGNLIFGTGLTSTLKNISTGNIGIGTSNPSDKFSIGNGGVGAPAGSSATGHNYTSTYLSTDNYALANVGYVNSLVSSSGGMATYSTSTPATYLGNVGSYTAANALCAAVVSGTHVCTSEEILYTINKGNAADFPSTATLWINNGPPAYTANANDCIGWTSTASNDFGTVWNRPTGYSDGFGSLNRCNIARKFACCK